MRVAVWGLGRHAAAKILPAIAAAPSLELAGVCSRHAGNVTDAALTYRCAGWTDPEVMLGARGVDVIYVATPIGLHGEHGERVLRAGKHLWCEKPITGDGGVARRLVDLSRAGQLAICEGYMYLHHPQFERLRSLIQPESLGRIGSLVIRFGLPALETPGFRTDPALGGGAFLDVGCYPVSALLALGLVERWRVLRASLVTRGAGTIDTEGSALLDGDGISALLEWRIHSSYRAEVDAWGDGGSVFTDRLFSKPPDHVPVFRIRDTRGTERSETGIAADHFQLMLRHFRLIMDDAGAVERERVAVIARAAMLDEIRRRASTPLQED